MSRFKKAVGCSEELSKFLKEMRDKYLWDMRITSKSLCWSFTSTHLLALNRDTKGALRLHIYEGKLFYTWLVAKVSPLQNLNCALKCYKTETQTEMRHLETGRLVDMVSPVKHQSLHRLWICITTPPNFCIHRRENLFGAQMISSQGQPWRREGWCWGPTSSPRKDKTYLCLSSRRKLFWFGSRGLLDVGN